MLFRWALPADYLLLALNDPKNVTKAADSFMDPSKPTRALLRVRAGAPTQSTKESK